MPAPLQKRTLQFNVEDKEEVRISTLSLRPVSLVLTSVSHPSGSQSGDIMNVPCFRDLFEGGVLDQLIPICSPVAWASDFEICSSRSTVGASILTACVVSSLGNLAFTLPITEGFSSGMGSVCLCRGLCRSYSNNPQFKSNSHVSQL